MKITLYRKYLMHDIDQWTYRLAEVHVADVVLKNEAQSDQKEDTDVTFFIRKITNALSDVKWLMGSRLKKESTDATDILQEDTESWKLTTKDDDKYSTDAQTLADLIHHYVVAHVIMHWASIYAADSVQSIATELNSLAGQVKDALFNISAPVKHRRPSYVEQVEISVENE